ncbi:EAL domain-containing protein, partial [Salmonella enterica subsp. enterica serovar Montevideo]|nr:EAL domain-containing protein [Salmonella enterica subsp. enterica serovar Montevideo]
LKQRVLDIIDILFSDTVKARFIDKELSNRYVPRGNRRKVQAQLTLGQLQQFGCQIAIDDFGTGYASYARLKNVNADILKID